MKHAYLIMCHNNFYNLRKLLLLLDNENNDIFLHIDKKVKNLSQEELKKNIKKSRLFCISEFNISWGGYSIVECEIRLIELALQNGNYDYIHLLSGSDLPLKNQFQIHEFFKQNKGKEFIQYIPDHLVNKYTIIHDRIKYYHFLQEFKNASKFKIVNVFNKAINKIIILFQKLIKFDRYNDSNENIKFGSQWFSITSDLAKYIINKKQWIYKTFKFTCCPDEMFIQMVAYNSPYKKNIYLNETIKSNPSKFPVHDIQEYSYTENLREINWIRSNKIGSPYCWKNDDFEYLKNSNKIFARKFDENVDKEIIDRVFDLVKNRSI